MVVRFRCMEARTGRAATWFASALTLIGLGAIPPLAPVPAWLVPIGWIVVFIGVMALGVSATLFYDRPADIPHSEVAATALVPQPHVAPAATPELACIRAGVVLAVEDGAGYAEWDTARTTYEHTPRLMLAATFRNEGIETVEVVRASLTYADAAGNTICTIDNGSWLDETVNWATVDPAETRHLLLVLFENAGVFAADDKRRDASDGRGLTLKPLPNETADLQINAILHIQDGNFRPIARSSVAFVATFKQGHEPTARLVG